MPKTLLRRVQVVLPVDLVALARREVMVRRQRDDLRDAAGAWKDGDHPELANSAADMVREDERLER